MLSPPAFAARWPGAPLLTLLVATLLLGCSSTPPSPPPQPLTTVPAPAPRPSVERPATPSVAAETRPVTPSYAGPWEDPSSPLFKRTLYFDYDSAELRADAIPVMRTHARYLGTQTAQRVTLEGHTDERGTREYNLALGDRRADAVRRFLIAEGVLPDQMATLSYGEERPARGGHEESAWQLNRRVIIQY